MRAAHPPACSGEPDRIRRSRQRERSAKPFDFSVYWRSGSIFRRVGALKPECHFHCARYTCPMQPVSIVATVLNEAQDIGRVVASLMAQEPPAAEVVIVDGGSSDGTWEWLAAAQSSSSGSTTRLVAIRDETCSLKYTPGPVSRGRNVAIAAAKSHIIATADAGCTYAPDWLANLATPLVAGQAQYALGGTRLDPAGHTVWDVASAPFFSIKLAPSEPTKSCTARSMAFTRALWQEIGGFPEDVLVGEDTLFDLEARRRTQPYFAREAKAIYRPQNTFRSAAHQLGRYAISDGQAGVRWTRMLRNAARCLLEVAALAVLPWTWIPLGAVFVLECSFAYKRDWRFLPRFGFSAVITRFLFSVAVPWIVAVNQVRGRFSDTRLTNKQNA
jgi:glycosyltransferase involved in cell wall biosynthesis